MGSSPIRVAIIFIIEKDLYPYFFQNALVAQSVEQGTENPRVGGSIPPQGTINLCESGSVVERYLAKVVVAGSIPVSLRTHLLT